VWHCFSGDQGLAQFAVAQGFALGFTGNVTYPRAEDIVRAARAVPGDRLLLETDAPYLSPAPHRSQRNEPNWLPLIAARVAEVRGEDIATAVAASVATFEAIFTRGA
jgi:TatD DNase family protein